MEWTAWKKANIPRAPRRTYTRRTPTTATSTPTTSLPQATSTPSTSMPLLPNDPLLQALTMPPILPSSSLPLMQLDNSYMHPFGTSMFNMSMGAMPLLPTVLPSTMQPSMLLPPLPMDPLVPLCAPLDGSLGAFGTTPMVVDSSSMAPSLPLLYYFFGLQVWLSMCLSDSFSWAQQDPIGPYGPQQGPLSTFWAQTGCAS